MDSAQFRLRRACSAADSKEFAAVRLSCVIVCSLVELLSFELIAAEKIELLEHKSAAAMYVEVYVRPKNRMTSPVAEP